MERNPKASVLTGLAYIPAVKASAGSFAAAAGALAAPWILWGIFRTTDVWHSAFFEHGAMAAADSGARVILLVVLLESCRGIGCLAGLRGNTTGSDLLAIASGFAISHIIGGLLGYLGLLSPIVACLYFGAGLAVAMRSRAVCLRPETFHCLPAGAWLAAPVALGVGLAFVLGRAIPIDIITNDFAHYLPYYEWVKANGRTFPSTYFIDTFYLKGAGLNHLVAQVSDPQGTQLAGGMAIILIALGTGWLATRLAWNSPLLGIVTATLVLLSKDFWVHVELEKAHALISAMLVMIVVLVAQDAERPLDPLERRAATISAFAVPFMLPVASVFLIPLCVLFPLACLRRHGDLARALQPLAAAILALAATLVFSFLTAGLLEFSPLKLMLALRNDGIMRRWIDPAAMLWLEAYNSQAFQIRFDPTSLSRNPLFLFCVGSLASSGAAFVMLRKVKYALAALATLVAAFLAYTIFLTIQQVFPGQQADLRRFSAFLPALAYLAPLAFVRLVLGHWNARVPALPMVHPGRTLSLLSLAAVATQVTGPFDIYVRSVARGVGMVMGGQSLDQQVQSSYPAAECFVASRLVPADSQILVMGFKPGCYVLPGVKFHRFEMNPINVSYSDALYGDPDAARQIYIGKDIRYFLFSGAAPYLATPAPQTFSPLFSPVNMANYFRIVARIREDSWLLTLGGEGTPVDQSFLEWYEGVRSKQANTASARAYYALARARGQAGP
jgi:hypothetical protein